MKNYLYIHFSAITWTIFISSIFLYSSLDAKNWYVRENGGSYGSENGTDWTNAFDGWSGIAWASISPGDTIFAGGGEYTQQLSPQKSGTSGNHIVIYKATVDRHGTSTGWQTSFGTERIIMDGNQYWAVELLEVDYFELNGGDQTFPYGWKIKAQNTDNSKCIVPGWSTDGSIALHLYYLELEGAGISSPNESTGIYNTPTQQKGNDNHHYKHIYIHDISTAIKLHSTDNIVIEYITWENIADAGPAHENLIWAQSCNNATVRYCKAHHWVSEGIFMRASNSNWYIYGNQLRADWDESLGTHGIATKAGDWTNTNIFIYNNTVTDISLGIAMKGSTTGEGKNNIIIDAATINWGGLSHDYNSYSGTDNKGETNAQTGLTSAIFIDYENQNLRLSDPTLDAGIPLSQTYNTDPDGNIRGADGSWDRGAFEYISGPPDSTPPSIPGNLNAAGITENQIQLAWSAATDLESGISKYIIYHDGNMISQSKSTNYTDRNLAANTEYRYEISAVNGIGLESERSESLTVRTLADQIPPRVDVIIATRDVVILKFSEPITTATAEDLVNYSINKEITINSLYYEPESFQVVLSTTSHEPDETYTITVNNIQDLNGNFIVENNYEYTTRSDLVAHWPLDEGAGGTIADVSGNLNQGIINGATWTTGRVGSALEFDGIDDFVDIGNLDITSNSGLTIAFWFKAHDFDIADARFISKATGTSDNDHYWMVSTINNNALRFRLKTNGITTTLISRDDEIVPEQWYHVAAVYDGAEMKVYKDGIMIISYSKTGNIDTNPSVSAALGNQPFGKDNRAFDGILDDIRLYNRPLTEKEILNLVNPSITQPLTNPFNLKIKK